VPTTSSTVPKRAIGVLVIAIAGSEKFWQLFEKDMREGILQFGGVQEGEKKLDEKKPDGKKTDEKKPDEKKTDEKKLDENEKKPGEFPRFDLILLGMGPDGHTASLFPGTAALQEKSRLVVANVVEKLKTSRLTLTLPVLNAARSVAFLVSGIDKAPALHAVLESDSPGEQYPSKLIRPTDGKLLWLIDRAAASQLTSTT